MRLNKYLAENTDLSRRKSDVEISNGHVKVNGTVATLGTTVTPDKDTVELNGITIEPKSDKNFTTIILNKPVGYVCSKNGQGSPTIYELLPSEHRNLNIAGRLDKDSSGLVVLTNDGNLLNELTHPSNNKEKIYKVNTDRDLTETEMSELTTGVDIGDSRLSLFKNITRIAPKNYRIILEEGRNRQIRRTLEALKLKTVSLQRLELGIFKLNDLNESKFRIITNY